MKVAIDVSPLKSGNFIQHRVRGTGYYLTNLKINLLKYYSDEDFIFFARGENLKKSPDLIHVPYFEPFFFTLPAIKKIKTIVTVHDLTPLVFREKFPSGVKGNIKWQLQKRRLKKSDRIITDSESSKKDIIEFINYPSEKIDVVYLAASDNYKLLSDKIKLKEIKEKYNLPDKFVLYVGDVTWNKNLPNLIKAINETDYNLIIVGKAFKNKEYDANNPWNQDLATAQVLASKNARIISLGFVEDDDLPLIYNLASVFTMPSFYEGFGLPLLEAMKSGIAVLTSDRGSIPEVCGDAAYYINPDDVESIKDGVIQLMKDENLRQDLVKKGLIQSSKFNWEKTARETFNSYKKAIESE